MKLIVITWPDLLADEGKWLMLLLEEGVFRIHVRKPNATQDEIRHLICSIPTVYHNRLVLHDHYSLANDFAVAGIHLNSRNVHQLGQKIPYSASCHSYDELLSGHIQANGYLFLSPIFDSISKVGYEAAFTPESLQNVASTGIINNNIIALGGIDLSRLSKIKQYGFGGIALLGAIWQPFLKTRDPQTLVEIVRSFQTQL